MKETAKVRLKKKINVTELSGEKVMVDYGSGKYFMLHGIANDVWDMLGEKVIPVSGIIDRILEEYEVDRETCTEEVLDFLEKLESLDLLEAE